MVVHMEDSMNVHVDTIAINPTAPRKTKITCNFGLSECNKVKFNIALEILYE